MILEDPEILSPLAIYMFIEFISVRKINIEMYS